MTIKHPGAIIQKLLNKLRVSVETFAKAMGMCPGDIGTVLKGHANVTPEVALRLEVVLREPAEHWMSLQVAYDISTLRKTGVVDPKLLTVLEPKPSSEVEEGYHGLPIWSNAFEICATPHEVRIINRADEVPADVLTAFEDGHKQGHLKGLGNLAFSKEAGKFGFLVTKFLTGHRGAGSLNLGDLGEYMGVELACLDSDNTPPYDDRIYLTAFIGSPEKFKDAVAISDVMSQIALNWNTKHNLDIPSQVAGAST